MATKDDLKRRLGLPVLKTKEGWDLRYQGQHPSHRLIEVTLGGHTGVDLTLPQTYAYVEVYEVVQHYGGPEEGGWYYHARQQAGPCVPLVAAVVAQGGPDDQIPDHLDNVPEGVEYLSFRHDDMYTDDQDGDGGWTLLAFLSKDAEEVCDRLVDLGFEQAKDRYGQGSEVVTSAFPGQHVTRRRPRYE